MEPLIDNAPSSNLIFDADMNNFMADVIEASQIIPVIVQFTAPWCGPCKTLSPILEQAVLQSGKVKLARVNIDENQQIAAQLRVQSVPTIYAFVGGQPVDGFQGAQPASAVTEFVNKLAAMAPGAPDISGLLAAGEQALSDGQGEEALAAYQQALASLPESFEALAGLIKAMAVTGAIDDAREIIDALEDEQLAKPVMREAVAAVELAGKTTTASGELAELEAAIAKDSNDLQARMDYALGLFAAGDRQSAMDALLESIAIDREWQDGAAKTQLLEFFEAIGPADPLVIKARRKLSSYLFS
ncbi:MAG: tetratricopeptide repeat protein [Candidatus Puniceispirillaceae bacterium]